MIPPDKMLIPRALIVTVLLWSSVVDAARKQTNKPIPKKIRKPNETFQDAIYTFLFLLSLLFVPLLIHFVYVIWNDPVTPLLIRDLTEYAQEKAFGYLGDMGVKIERKNSKFSRGKRTP